MKTEALKLLVEALSLYETRSDGLVNKALAAGKEALAQPKQKYRRGNRLICLETEEYCVIHISGTDRQWIKFPDSHIGVYTNEQVAELFELLPKEPEQEPVAWMRIDHGSKLFFDEKPNPSDDNNLPLYTTSPQRKPLSGYINGAGINANDLPHIVVEKIERAIKAAHGIKA